MINRMASSRCLLSRNIDGAKDFNDLKELITLEDNYENSRSTISSPEVNCGEINFANQWNKFDNDPRYYYFNNSWKCWRKEDYEPYGLKPMSKRLKDFEMAKGAFFTTFDLDVSDGAKYDDLYAQLYQDRIISEMKSFVKSFKFGNMVKVHFLDDLNEIKDYHQKVKMLMDPMTLFLPPMSHFLPWSNEINGKNSATRIHKFSQAEFDRFTRLLKAEKSDVGDLTNILGLHVGSEGKHTNANVAITILSRALLKVSLIFVISGTAEIRDEFNHWLGNCAMGKVFYHCHLQNQVKSNDFKQWLRTTVFPFRREAAFFTFSYRHPLVERNLSAGKVSMDWKMYDYLQTNFWVKLKNPPTISDVNFVTMWNAREAEIASTSN